MNRKFFKPLLLAAAGVAVMLAGCGDTIVDVTDPAAPIKDEIRPEVRLNIVVRDTLSGSILDGAKVTLLTRAEEKTTDAATPGTVSFDNVYVGEHRVLVEMSGYASIIRQINISDDGIENKEVYIAQEATRNVSLYPLNARLEGKLFYEDRNTNKTVPAQGAKVRVTLTSAEFVDRYPEVPVNADGEYVFTNLPAAPYSIEALNFTVGDNIYQGINLVAVTLKADASVVITAIEKYSNILHSIELRGFPKGPIGISEEMEFEFSQEVDVSQITPSTITINPAQAVNIVWDANKVTIKPVAQGRWITNASGLVRIIFATSLYSVNGTSLSTFFRDVLVANADLSAIKVSGLVDSTATTIDTSSGSVRIRWNSVEDADGYRVYIKDGNDNYRLAAETLAHDDTVTGINLRDKNGVLMKIGFKELRFIVQAYNSTSQTSLEGLADGTNVLVVKAKPTIADMSLRAVSDSVVNFGYYSENEIKSFLETALVNADAAELASFSIVFTEPMENATGGGTITIPSSSNWHNSIRSRVELTYTWSDDGKTMTLILKVNAGDIVTPRNHGSTVISIPATGLRPENGGAARPFEIKYSPTSKAEERVTKPTLDFRLPGIAIQ